jgi:hypothetical protein
MNKETISKLQSLCLASLELANEYNERHEFRRLILNICNEIDDIIEESEIEEDYKQSKREGYE